MLARLVEGESRVVVGGRAFVVLAAMATLAAGVKVVATTVGHPFMSLPRYADLKIVLGVAFLAQVEMLARRPFPKELLVAGPAIAIFGLFVGNEFTYLALGMLVFMTAREIEGDTTSGRVASIALAVGLLAAIGRLVTQLDYFLPLIWRNPSMDVGLFVVEPLVVAPVYGLLVLAARGQTMMESRWVPYYGFAVIASGILAGVYAADKAFEGLALWALIAVSMGPLGLGSWLLAYAAADRDPGLFTEALILVAAAAAILGAIAFGLKTAVSPGTNDALRFLSASPVGILPASVALMTYFVNCTLRKDGPGFTVSEADRAGSNRQGDPPAVWR